MILYNLSQKTILTNNLKEAKSLPDKLLGLHKKTNPRSLLFKTRFGIHTFFLAKSIDVLVLNKKNKVSIAKTIQPNRIFIYNPCYSIVIELPAGTIRKSKIQKGDKLIIKKHTNKKH
ncbi:MAG: hypothetical protein UU23_C0001G0076 [Candidatus Curtissbacteria bacterium GW2011_GWA1_40_9]|uniref:DUF192 domain-containing protein n=1 Tax=Candidatus Curtissbacteria bacterium GW2011_GWA1_40_9 TaxID=1618408 RepID=A0A0G0WSF9_9BACT|nr:MAG: hypothetical protein UU23_C0001G0076 [Candidatus Curtissbacteria bacterium GW2011_GWA1_40_9]